MTAGGAPCRVCVPDRSKKRLIQRQGFDGGCQVFHHGAYLARGGHIGLEPGFYDHRFGAQLQGFEHGHGRTHAVDARDIARGRHHAALAAAHDHRLITQGRVVALFHAGIERVAIHVGDTEVEQFRARHNPAAMAGRANAARRGIGSDSHGTGQAWAQSSAGAPATRAGLHPLDHCAHGF